MKPVKTTPAQKEQKVFKALEDAFKNYEEIIKLGSIPKTDNSLEEEMSQFKWDRPLNLQTDS